MDTRKRITSMLLTLPLAVIGALVWYVVGGIGVLVSAYCCICIGIIIALVATDVDQLKKEGKV